MCAAPRRAKGERGTPRAYGFPGQHLGACLKRAGAARRLLLRPIRRGLRMKNPRSARVAPTVSRLARAVELDVRSLAVFRVLLGCTVLRQLWQNGHWRPPWTSQKLPDSSSTAALALAGGAPEGVAKYPD